MRFAVNPLQFQATPDGQLDPAHAPDRDAVLAAVVRAGFEAVQIEAEEDAESQQERLGAHGLAPAPGYLAGALENPAARPAIERRFRAAAATSATLGLDRIVVACELTPERIATAGRHGGRPPDLGAIASVAGGLRALARIGEGIGVAPCFHPHVGTAVESPEEIAALVDMTDVFLCPDSGHLVCGGCDDVAGLLAGLWPRVGMLHLKDIRLEVASRGRAEGWPYARAVRERLWREPGEGDLPLDAVMARFVAAPIWAVIEVDAPARPSVAESLSASRAYAARWEAPRHDP